MLQNSFAITCNGLSLDNLWGPVAETFGVVFDPRNFTTWEFWVFLYVAISISTHLAPSGKDMEGVWIGLGAALVLVLAINGIAVAAGWDFVTELVGLFSLLKFVGRSTQDTDIDIFLSYGHIFEPPDVQCIVRFDYGDGRQDDNSRSVLYMLDTLSKRKRIPKL